MKEDKRLKKRIFDIIQIGQTGDLISRLFDFFIVIVILLNILMMFLETFDSMAPYIDIIHAIEYLTLIVFIVEYALRIWTAEYLFPGVSKGKAVFEFVTSFDGIIDLLTILPFFFLSGFVAFRMLRVVRIFHLFRVNTKYDSFNVIRSVLYEKRNQLASSVFIILMLMLASSLCMYSAEHEVQPENFKNAFSGIWWSVSTMLTIGYGDIYPLTTLGKFMAVVISFLGVGVVAIPTGIISAGFVEQYNKAQNSSFDLDVSLHSVIVDIDSVWLGKSTEELKKEFGIITVLVKRDGDVMMPNSDYRVAMKDALIVHPMDESSSKE